MTLEDELEATIHKRRLLVLYRNSELTIRDDSFRFAHYEDVANTTSVIAALTQLKSKTP